MTREIVEDFFINRVDTVKIFKFMERSEYLFVYNIQSCMDAEGSDRAYIADIAKKMDKTVIETSRGVKNLEDKGFVTWHTDIDRERTYVMLTPKAKDIMSRQSEILEKTYNDISSEVPVEELEQAASTLAKVRNIVVRNVQAG